MFSNYHKLGPKYVKLSQTQEEMIERQLNLYQNLECTKHLGCIDGTHVQIVRPPQYSQDYFCYKQYFSINVQAFCDFRVMFMDCKWPGSVHDDKVFSNSSIGAKL